MKFKESIQKLEIQRLGNTCLVVYNLLTIANKQRKILSSTENCVDHHTGNQSSIQAGTPIICALFASYLMLSFSEILSLFPQP